MFYLFVVFTFFFSSFFFWLYFSLTYNMLDFVSGLGMTILVIMNMTWSAKLVILRIGHMKVDQVVASQVVVLPVSNNRLQWLYNYCLHCPSPMLYRLISHAQLACDLQCLSINKSI